MYGLISYNALSLAASVYCMLFALVSQSPVAEAKYLDCGTSVRFGCITKYGKLQDTKKIFDKINIYLEENVKSDNITENMQAISEWLKVEANRVKAKMSREEKPKTRLLGALVLFSELGLQDLDSECTKTTDNAMMANNRAMRDPLGRARNNQRLERRIERILLHLYQNHSKKCTDYCMSQYRAGLEKIGDEKLMLVRDFVGELVKAQIDGKTELLNHYKSHDAYDFLKHRPLEASKLVKSFQSFGSSKDALHVLIALKAEFGTATSSASSRPRLLSGAYRETISFDLEKSSELQREASNLFQSKSSKDRATNTMINLNQPSKKSKFGRIISGINEKNKEAGRLSAGENSPPDWLTTAIVERFISAPCRKFEAELEAAFSLDHAILKVQELNPEDAERGDFYRDLTLYRACQQFHDSEQKLVEELDKLIPFLKAMPAKARA